MLTRVVYSFEGPEQTIGDEQRIVNLSLVFKPIATDERFNNRKTLENHKKINGGFTLVEMIVVITIVGLATTWALPQFKRSLEQSKVDRYTQNLESGLFNLKTRLQKASKK